MANYSDILYQPVAYPSGLMNAQDNVLNVANQSAGGPGVRQDGTGKGQGFLGPLATGKQGQYATEISTEENINGKPTLFPLITPNQGFKDLSNLLTGGKPTDQMYQQALLHAITRALTGRSTFAEDTEVPQSGGSK